MKRMFWGCLLVFWLVLSLEGAAKAAEAITADHQSANDFSNIPTSYLTLVRSTFDIYYGHTSHGSQVITGLSMLEDENNGLYAWPTIYDDYHIDLGDPSWVPDTRNYLNAHPETNLVMWSWCGQLSWYGDSEVNDYLSQMNGLEANYPGVTFVYMTGHLDGGGRSGTLYMNNDRIRTYCATNNKVLYDFADIESYDPDVAYYPYGSDWCEWCVTWCASHSCPGYGCEDSREDCAHSQCFNCYRKGKAFWWLLARLAGWKPSAAILYVNKNGTCGGMSPCYTTIQGAMNVAGTGEQIRIAQGTYDESLVFNESKSLTLQGGWDSTFTSQSLYTTVNSITETSGDLYTENLGFEFTANAGFGGTISPSGGVFVNYTSDQNFTITPDSGYQILDVLVDGSSVGAVVSHTFENVSTGHTIAASFEVASPPIAEFSGNPTTGTVPLTVNFTDHSTGYVTSWEWAFGDDNATSTAQNPSHIYNDQGKYTVALTVTGPGGSDIETKSDYITANAGAVGSLKITLSPQDAIDGGAQWNAGGGAWQDSETTLTNLTAGDHTVYFKDIDGWIPPRMKTVTVIPDQTTEILAAYSQETGRLPDTGQMECYNNSEGITCPQPGEDFYGQDASFLINPPSYTKLDDQGNDLPDDATEWVMVRDNVTGLIWEVKKDDGSIHDKDNKYPWDAVESAFIAPLNDSSFGGFSAWRTPTIKELSSIVQLRRDYVIDTRFFPENPRMCWSITTYACDTNNALGISGDDDFDASKAFTKSVRAVRGRQLKSSFVNNGDATVTDTCTGLMWQQTTGTVMGWEATLSYCEGLSLGGYNDWRSPNRKELRSIVDYQRCNPAIDIDFFTETFSSYWSSSSDGADSAWQMRFNIGKDLMTDKLSFIYVRAVRGGQNRISGHLVILTPAQGSRWNIGTSIPITWEHQDIPGNVKISISRQGGKDGTFETIEESTENDGIYEWTATGPVSCNCMLKIEPLDDPSKATTRGLFTIASTILPTATISGVPNNPTNQIDASLTVGGESIISYKYKLDGGDYGSEILVANPIALTDLADGSHTIYVLGRDAAGDWQIVPTTATWTVDTQAPIANIYGVPDSPTCQTGATIIVSGVDVSHYKYKPDSGSYSDEINISQPIIFSALTGGSHTLLVLGRDLAGNWQTEPTTGSWTVLTTLSITATAGLGGTIIPSGSITVPCNADQSFTITPDTAYQVSDVLVDGSSVGAVTSYTFSNVTEDHTIEASFTILTYTITATADVNGSITPSGDVTVSYGADQTFTLTPVTSYHVSDVLVDGSSVGAVTSYTFTNVIEGHTIHAEFALNTYVVVGRITENGTGLENVFMDGLPRRLWSDPNGFYSVKVDYGWSGTVIPEKRDYAFEPVFRNFSNVTSNQLNQNFAATQIAAINLGHGNGRRGGQATIPVIFTPVDNPDISAISVDIGYDTSALESPTTVIGAAASAADKEIATSEISPGVYRISIFSPANNNPIGVGIISYLTFHISLSAPFDITPLSNTPNASDPSGHSVLIGGTDGTINVTQYAAGDCDESGSVSIAEVQYATNMFLEITPVEPCVDVTGDEEVGIGEVQKVINNHLMVTAQASESFDAAEEHAIMANGIPSLDLARISGKPGETVRVPVTLSNASGYEIAAVSMDVSYDVAVFENAKAEIGPAGSAAGKYVVFNEISSGILRVGVSGVNQNLIGDGVVAYVVFDIKTDAVMGKTDLGNAPSASDPSGNDVPIEGESGAVTAMIILYVSHDGVCNGNQPCFTLIQDAIDAADSVTLIKVTEGTYDEDLVIDQPKTLTIQGGWDSTFTTRTSDTTVKSMRISDGTVRTEYLVIR